MPMRPYLVTSPIAMILPILVVVVVVVVSSEGLGEIDIVAPTRRRRLAARGPAPAWPSFFLPRHQIRIDILGWIELLQRRDGVVVMGGGCDGMVDQRPELAPWVGKG
jgi:hypothetical protein